VNYSFLDPVFGFLLDIPPWLSLLFIALVFVFITTIIYKYTTNQTQIKELKAKQKKLNKDIRASQKDDPQKALALQKEAMSLSGQLMKQSFNLKSMLYTILPILLIFGWFSAHFSFLPLLPNEPFDVTAHFADGATGTISLSSIPELTITGNATQTISNDAAVWELQGPEGTYQLFFNYSGEEYVQDILITTEQRYEEPIKFIKDSKLEQTVIGNNKLKPWPPIPILGGVNWLWAYLIYSIVLSFPLRKLLKVA